MNSNPKSEILFRCSRLGDLVTEPRLKSEAISETAKTLVRNVWLQKEFGYKEDVMTDEMLKGHICEQDSLGLVKQVLGGEFRVKNTLRFRNDYIEGTPDIILKKQDFVEDVKTSYNLRTFTEAELIKNYYWQGQGYMWLTGKTKYRLMYCLVPTPEEIVTEQKKRWYFKFNCDESNPHYMEMAAQIEHNNNLISKLPAENRIKIFEFDFEPEKIEVLKAKILVSRQYYNTLKLPMAKRPIKEHD
ncbi:hypothetical protein FEM33_15600 [Dyadobacter flavalbus]|uniref:YqaJ viral recombinase domain-containing protein n=1 Tax=Dyadobacter flavalbus TaxID=2579942 RepID=A0A5M8QWQ2_9BACT|nr:hypothetical protein [Dyadobacter flavalbus]KAA6438843.1 hypothetical protein FEM33_15600 [Dyadobacter flavalbus]